MLLRDRPLLVDGIDRHLYVERPALQRAVEEPLLNGRNVLLLGEGGAGKSTLMRSVVAHLQRADRDVVWVNAAPAGDAVSFLELVSLALGDDGPGGSDRPSASLGDAVSLLVAVRRLRAKDAAIIVVDDLSDAEIGYTVFGRLRDELWEAGHVWLVAARPRDSGALRSPPADAFWGAVVEIPPLDADEVTSLLTRGLDDDEYARVASDRALSGILPRALIRDVQRRLAADGPPDDVALSTKLEERANHLGRSEAMAMAELLGIGRPVSAHDPDLLERLGWSRPYAQRMLSHLESAGLVRSFPERTGERTGRPRKLYEPNPVKR